MLTVPTPVPPNSTSPLPANWGSRQADSLFNLFSAGLTQEPTVACAPGPSAFAYLAPPGFMFPVVTSNPSQPALSTAVLSPAPASPLAAQVYQTQQMMQQGLTTSNAQLAPAVDLAGQSGASVSSVDFQDAAEVYPMSFTTSLVLEKTPLSQRQRRKRPPQNPNFPGTPWGGVPVSVPGGGCNPQGLSGWAMLFLLAGAGVLAYAALEH
jgi:hypothetical protein